MKVLSLQEAVEWCQAHQVAVNHRCRPDRSGAGLRFEIPIDAQKRVNLVSQAMEAFRSDPSFLVLFDDWSVWPSGQRMHVFDRFRMSYGEKRRLIEAPGHVFDATEIEDATSFVTIAALFLWDCYVVNSGSSRLLYLSHDEYGVTSGLELQTRVPWLTLI
jgi:hypothetical protein